MQVKALIQTLEQLELMSFEGRFSYFFPPGGQNISSLKVQLLLDPDVVQRYQPSSLLDGLCIEIKPYLSMKVVVIRENNSFYVFKCAIFRTSCIFRGGTRVIGKSL